MRHCVDGVHARVEGPAAMVPEQTERGDWRLAFWTWDSRLRLKACPLAGGHQGQESEVGQGI
eukprot:6807041-Pyramimonas_sp.AAC.1